MNRFGRIASDHWKKWLPKRYAALPDPEKFFSDLGEEIEEAVQEMALNLAGNDPPGEGYMQKLGRLNMARFNAESDLLREMALLEPEPGVDQDEEKDES